MGHRNQNPVRGHRRVCVGIAVAIVFVVGSHPSAAVPLTPATFAFGASSGATEGGRWTNFDDKPGRIEFSDSWKFENYDYAGNTGGVFENDYSMSGYVEAFGGALPKIQFSLGMTGDGPANGNPSGQTQTSAVTGRINYFVGVAPIVGAEPPSTPSTVPLRIQANGTVTASAEGMASCLASGAIRLYWFQSPSFNGIIKAHWSTADTTQGIGDGFLAVDETVSIGFNSQLWVQMETYAACATKIHNNLPPAPAPHGSAHTSGYLDPIITIDPTWEYADYYQLEFSEGIEPYVPEPTALCLLAISGVAMLRRRDRRVL